MDEVGLGGCSGKCSEVARDERLGLTQGNEQQLVDDVNNAVVEFEVLCLSARYNAV